MKKTILSLTSTAVVAIALLFTTKSSGLVKMFAFGKQEFTINYVAAKTNNELADIRNNRGVNIIRSEKDLDKIIESYVSPLSLLSKEDLAQFKSTLVERKGAGIVSLKYSEVQKKLSKQDFEKLMSMFGLDVKKGFWGLSEDQHVINQIRGSSVKLTNFEDYPGYKCVSAHNCARNEEYICLTGC